MRPVARGHTKAFVQFNVDNKIIALRELMEKTGNRFTGRLEGAFKLNGGEINVVIEVKNGAIVAMGITGIEEAKGTLAMRRFTELFPKITGFFEIIELNEAGVDLDLEYNNDYKLTIPSSLNLFIERLKLRIEREITESRKPRPSPTTQREVRKTTTKSTPHTTPVSPPKYTREPVTSMKPLRPSAQQLRREELERPYMKPTRKEAPTAKPQPPHKTIEVKKKETRTKVVEIKEVEKQSTLKPQVITKPLSTREEKAHMEKPKALEKPTVKKEELAKEVVEVSGKEVQVESKLKAEEQEFTAPEVIEAVHKTTVLPKVETAQTIKPIPADMLLEEVEAEEKIKVPKPKKVEEVKRTPEEIISGLPLDDGVDKISKILSMDKDRLILALSSSLHLLKHDKGTVLDALRDIVDASTMSDLPVQLIIRKGGIAYNVIAYKGLIKAAFKINEEKIDVELIGKETLHDLVKTLYKDEFEYTLVNMKEDYVLIGMGLKTVEEEIEEQTEGLLGKLRKLFGSK